MSHPRPEPELEAWLASEPEPDLTDPDDPEWTEEDFARAVGPEHLSRGELAAFPKTAERVARMGRPRKPDAKQAVSLRLDPEVLEHFKAGGPGWQSRINAKLREALPPR